MALPLYENVGEIPTPRNGHAGLWFERFFNAYPDDWRPDRDDAAKKAWIEKRTAWMNKLTGMLGDRSACVAASERLARLCAALGGESRMYTGTWHFATGLGNPHPVENGFLWHSTLGAPYIPGSAVKGLVRSWVEAWMPFEEETQRCATLYRWFGSEDKNFKERKRLRGEGFQPPSLGRDFDTVAGAFLFFDALPTGPVTIKTDVMTPHMGKWYEQGGEIASVGEADKLPSDWHDPIPVCFLVADKPRFQFCVAPRRAESKDEIPHVMQALGDALELLGAGAKTAVGYGIMTADKAASSPAGDKDEWPGVTLSFQPGSTEIGASHGDAKAFVSGEEAKKLLEGFSASRKKKLKKGELRATLVVEKIGGKNWKIVAIKP